MLSDEFKHLVDMLSITNVILVVMNLISNATIVLSFVWICIRVYETTTFQRVVMRRKQTRKTDLERVVSIIEEGDPKP